MAVSGLGMGYAEAVKKHLGGAPKFLYKYVGQRWVVLVRAGLQDSG